MGKLKTKPDGLGKSSLPGKSTRPGEDRRTLGELDGIDRVAVAQKLAIKEIKFLEEYARADGTGVRAMLKLHPKSTYQAAHTRAWRMMKSIDSKISPEEKFALMGLTTGLVSRVIREAADANFQKEFVTKDGDRRRPGHPDHQIRLDAMKLAAKVIGLEKNELNQAISINVINYAPPGAAPWPTSGASNPEIIDVSPEKYELRKDYFPVGLERQRKSLLSK
jgi:hypothetical protein